MKRSTVTIRTLCFSSSNETKLNRTKKIQWRLFSFIQMSLVAKIERENIFKTKTEHFFLSFSFESKKKRKSKRFSKGKFKVSLNAKRTGRNRKTRWIVDRAFGWCNDEPLEKTLSEQRQPCLFSTLSSTEISYANLAFFLAPDRSKSSKKFLGQNSIREKQNKTTNICFWLLAIFSWVLLFSFVV